MGSGRGPGTREGPCCGARASAMPLSPGPRGGDPGGLSGEEEQAVAGSTGGGLRGLWGLWAARRGPEAPPGGVRALLRGRAGSRGAADRPERVRGEPRGTPEETGAGGSLGEIEGFPRERGGAPKWMEVLYLGDGCLGGGMSLGMSVWRGLRRSPSGWMKEENSILRGD